MKREISSFLTLYLRILLPGFFVISGVVLTFIIVFRSANPNPLGTSALVFAGLCLLAAVISFIGYGYKKVTIDGTNLLISDYRRVITVPVSNIADVTELRLRGHPVTIHLKTASEYGDKITFLAKSRSIVGELKVLAGIGQ